MNSLYNKLKEIVAQIRKAPEPVTSNLFKDVVTEEYERRGRRVPFTLDPKIAPLNDYFRKEMIRGSGISLEYLMPAEGITDLMYADSFLGGTPEVFRTEKRVESSNWALDTVRGRPWLMTPIAGNYPKRLEDMEDDYLVYEVIEIIRTEPDAWLLNIEDRWEKWIPKSICCLINSEIAIPDKFAQQQGLEI